MHKKNDKEKILKVATKASKFFPPKLCRHQTKLSKITIYGSRNQPKANQNYEAFIYGKLLEHWVRTVVHDFRSWGLSPPPSHQQMHGWCCSFTRGKLAVKISNVIVGGDRFDLEWKVKTTLSSIVIKSSKLNKKWMSKICCPSAWGCGLIWVSDGQARNLTRRSWKKRLYKLPTAMAGWEARMPLRETRSRPEKSRSQSRGGNAQSLNMFPKTHIHTHRKWKPYRFRCLSTISARSLVELRRHRDDP